MRSCDCPFCAAYRSRLLAGRKGGALPAGDFGVPMTRVHGKTMRSKVVNFSMQPHSSARQPGFWMPDPLAQAIRRMRSAARGSQQW